MSIIKSTGFWPGNHDVTTRTMRSVVRSYWTGAEGYQKFLYLCGGLLLLSAIFHLGVLLLSADSWQGDVSWRKPIVFGEAFGVTCISLAWVMTFLSKRRILGWILAAIFGIASMGEVALITMQQWRGVPSHFNTSTPFDAAVFSNMGLLVILVELITVVMTVWAFVTLDAPSSLKWTIRIGMLFLVVAQLFGNLIVSNGSNMFGEAGMLKIPHALALHALQILPLMAWLLLFTHCSPSRRTWAITLGTLGYIGVVAVSVFQTFNGKATFDLSIAPGLLLGISVLAFIAASIMTLWSLHRMHQRRTRA